MQFWNNSFKTHFQLFWSPCHSLPDSLTHKSKILLYILVTLFFGYTVDKVNILTLSFCNDLLSVQLLFIAISEYICLILWRKKYLLKSSPAINVPSDCNNPLPPHVTIYLGERNLQQVINLFLLVFILCILLHERKATKFRLLLHKPQCNGRMLKCLLTSRTCSKCCCFTFQF